MSRERLRLYMRRRQLVNDTGNVIVVCNEDGSATYEPGITDQSWEEFTDYTRGLEKVSLAWDKINKGNDSAKSEVNAGGSNYDKGISLSVVFNDAAFQFIDAWLLENPCGTLNAVEVRIDDALCNKSFRIFEIKADNLTELPDDAPCEIEVKLREMDSAWHGIHKTFIWDNWQNWFKEGGSKQHPCFLTAIEPRPRLVNSARAGLAIFWQAIPKTPTIPLPLGNDVMRRILNVDNFVDAPLVRDIITNVCGKLGLGIHTMFHDPDNPYYNLCLYYPLSGAVHVNDSGTITANALWFHFENRWNITLAEFLDKLKPVFEAEWYVTPGNTLIFQPLDYFKNVTPITNFITNGLPVYNLQYTFSGDRKPAYGRYEYTLDGADLASHEALPLYNDIVDYDGPADNLMLEGSRTKSLEFAATGFVRDGKARGDYLRDVINDGETVAYAVLIILVVVVFALTAGILSAGAGAVLAAIMGVWAINIAGKASDYRNTFGSAIYTGAVRVTADEIAQPRLVLWNGVAMNRAKAVQVAPAVIAPNTYYNPSSLPYNGVNKFIYNPVGGLFIFNYPMYFESFFTGNLFDRYHDAQDNPMKNLAETNRIFEFQTDLCCEMLDTLGAWAGDFAKIGYFIIIKQRSGYEIRGRIDHFEILYEDERILLRGKLYKIKI